VASPNFAAGQVAKVQLSDCLACSGCLTSAETVLFQQQTSSTLKALEQAPETPKVVSLSSASRAALANFFGVPPADAGVGLLKVLEELGSFRILDAGLAHSLVLDEALEEFLGRYQEQRQKGERRRKRGRHAVEWRKNAAEAPVTEAGLPLLASECPGWVLYVEKSAPEALPYISRVKSSMRVSGWIAKVSEAFWTAREPPTRTVVAFHFSLNEHTTIYPWKTAREEYSAPFWHPKMGSATRVGRLLEPPQSPFFFGSRVRWSMCDRSKVRRDAMKIDCSFHHLLWFFSRPGLRPTPQRPYTSRSNPARIRSWRRRGRIRWGRRSTSPSRPQSLLIMFLTRSRPRKAAASS